MIRPEDVGKMVLIVACGGSRRPSRIWSPRDGYQNALAELARR